VFDGNLHSIAGSYWFDLEKNRTIAVHPGSTLRRRWRRSWASSRRPGAAPHPPSRCPIASFTKSVRRSRS
jgi:hypothetical protein